jgi:hypothetical protein
LLLSNCNRHIDLHEILPYSGKRRATTAMPDDTGLAPTTRQAEAGEQLIRRDAEQG